MAIDVAALAASGASTLVGLMASESWEQVKTRLARFFARRAAAGDPSAPAEGDRADRPEGQPDGPDDGRGALTADPSPHTGDPGPHTGDPSPLTGEAARDLTRAQRELALAMAAADEQAAADVEAEWRGRLRRLLRDDPRAARELRDLLAELAREAGLPDGGGDSAEVRNSISGGVQHGPVIQGRDFHGGLRFDTGSP